ncbi:unnamed protein product [Didymodactylos carnosus]|uniref:Transmembrane protein 183 n=1 Tax=Didymodactylos carnosus TaxID=1234261 RepID=A0A813PDJ3_9BILA|nr:unnamed protein product [Didymodactylos carnosus]CAF0793764.1 unnamed protein product [Didymodactylos carnosus]CAF3533380.1 unnamed protein product [Didymodactylos carnosus]CAF3576604.1 unnamed protein product [Didymodactylos carnosus]
MRLAFKDFSVYDYSRSTKDSPQNNLRTSSKLTRESKDLMSEQDWYEKDLSDFDDPQLSDEENEVVRLKRHTKQNASVSGNDIQDERAYPLDFWFILSLYIAPEDIGRFSSICRASHYVVGTPWFWLKKYVQYNKSEAKQLTRLLTKEKAPIIRTHVIKSLYSVYPVFQERLNKTDVIQKDPYFLEHWRCIRIWHTKSTNNNKEGWNYYFEFRFDSSFRPKSKQTTSTFSVTNNSSNSSAIATEYLVDKDCCVLHLYCSNFVPVGPFMGMILSKINLNVSSDYRYHKIKMWFGTSSVCLSTASNKNSAQNVTNSVVIIDPILFLKIYHWWNSPSKFE